jgi:exopolyphosphatase / guanosine-5'-triphosphate,3'-diphosphate pyrophosphatase
MARMRVAAADIGTNSTRLLVADVTGDGSVTEVERLLAITRLGEGVDAGGALAATPMGRVTAALERYAGRARALAAERLLAVATSAVRDAANRDDFLTRVSATGFEPRLLSGEEEAAATFAGVGSHAPGATPPPGDGTLVIDVGGGSTELVLGAAGGIAWSRSLQAGCVRMTERHLGEDRITASDLAACASAVGELLTVVPDAVVAATRRATAVAGTATTLAAIANGGYDAAVVHGARITRVQVRELQARLAAMPLADRSAVPGLEPERAPVIVGGLVVLGCVLDRFGLAEAVVSERDILHGAALLAAAQHVPGGS